MKLRSLLLALVTLWGGEQALSLQSDNFDELACVTSLELPTRGFLAATSSSSGTVHARIEIGLSGRASRIELSGANPLLQGEVRVGLNQSRFSEKCSGKQVELLFQFTLEGSPTDTLRPPAVRFLPPNRFELVFRRLKPVLDGPPPR